MKVYLRPADYRRAIYLDFEGEGASTKTKVIPAPHMVGVFRPNETGKSGVYESILFRSAWRPVSNGAGKTSQCMAFDTYFEALCDIAVRENRYLVYWSQYEEKVLEQLLSNRLFTKIKPHLHNLLPPARKYANRRRSFGEESSASKKSLEEFFAALYRKRSPFPPLVLGAAEVCRRIDKACSKTKRWASFSDKQKGYAKDLLAYNQGDCRATWLIARRLGNAIAKNNITQFVSDDPPQKPAIT